MKDNYHQRDQDSPIFIGEEYYRVVEDTASEGFSAQGYYKVVDDIGDDGFTAEEYYKITKGPEKADSLEDLDKPPEVEETLKVEEGEVVTKVCEYFSKTFNCQNLSPVCKVSFPVGSVKDCEADVVLRGNESQPFVAIAECKGSDGANYGRRQLWGYLCANNTRFGLFASSLNPDDWIFYENLRHFRFRRIERSQFESEVAAGNCFIEVQERETADSMEDLSLQVSDCKPFFGDKAEREVRAYFSKIISQTWRYSLEKNFKIQIGSEEKPCIADFVLRGRDGSFIAIVDTKYRESKNVKGSILHTLLSATDTKFGIIAHSADRNKWKFVEKLGINQFNNDLEPDAFGAMVVAQAREAACPVFKGQELSQKEWNQYSKTWKTLKSKHFWRVTEIFHPDCSFTVGEEISNVDYQRAREDYQYSVKKGDILTKAKLAKIREIWPNLVVKSVWCVTKVFHPRCSLTVGQYVSQTEYEQVRVDYPGCSVKKGDILTKPELTEYRKTWKNLNAEKIWCITDTNYRQARQRIRDEQDQSQFMIRLWQSLWGIATLEYRQEEDERDKFQSKIKLWQFVTASVGVFLFCFAVLFLRQRDATEDAVHQSAMLASQLTHKESEIRQKDSVAQDLTISVQTLNGENETLSQKISELENQQRNRRTLPIDTTFRSVEDLQKQLNGERNENQEIQDQLSKKDAEIRQLRSDKAVVLRENRELQNRLVEDKEGGTNQSPTVRQLQDENQELQNQNTGLTRQNRELRNQNKALQHQLDSAKQDDSDQVNRSPSGPNDGQQSTVPPETKNLVAEPPEKSQDSRDVIARARSHNNQGWFDFKNNNYGEAIKQFEQAVKADSKFVIAHYNLGCVYLEMKKYRGAVDAFDEAIALAQKFKEAYYNRSFAYFRMSKFQEAKLDVTKALDIDPNYRLAQGLLTAIENVQQ